MGYKDARMPVPNKIMNRAIRRVAWLPELLLVVASLVFVTLFIEVALRMFRQYRPNDYPPRSQYQGFEAYEPYGYRLIPSRRTTYLYPHKNPRTLSLVSNRDGFRAGRELDEPEARPRILFLGDSFVFGDGVEEAERFTDVLETLRPSWRIDNLGMVGYGPDLMLRALEVVGLKLKPAVVFFCMYTDDFRRVRPEYAGTGFLIPRYQLESGHLVSRPYPTPDFWDQLRISIAFRKILWNYTSRQWDLNQAILDRFEQLADNRRSRKAIVFLPGREDTRADRERRSWLRQYSGRRATPFLDLSGAIHNVGKQAFIEGNPHLNPAGHQVVARELDRFLTKQVLAPN
jgi:hypothetical protein